jgi:hypothetical protein
MRFLFVPFSVVGGVLAGALGRWLFSVVWGALDDQEPPESEHLRASWSKVLLASAVRGAIFAGRTSRRRSGIATGVSQRHRLVAGRTGTGSEVAL